MARDPEIIADHNDPYKVEWIDLAKKPDHLSGDKALRVPWNATCW